MESAQFIAAGRSCPVEPADRLRELDFGDFEGRPYDEIAESYPDIYREWMEHPTEVEFPGGESFKNLADRVNSATRELVARHSCQQIAFVSHGGPIRVILGNVLGMQPDDIFRIGQSYGAVNRIRYSGSTGIVELVNSGPEQPL